MLRTSSRRSGFIEVKRYWSLADKAALFLSVASTTTFVVKHSYLDHVAAPIGVFFDVGQIVDGAISSLVAGSIFFLVVNRLAEIKDREILDPWIRKKKLFIVGQFDSAVAEIAKTSQIHLDLDSSELDFAAALGGIQANSNASLMNFQVQWMTWLPYFKYQLDRMKKGISDLLNNGRFLTASEMRLLCELDDHHLSPMIDAVLSAPLNPKSNLSFCASSFHGLGGLLRELR